MTDELSPAHTGSRMPLDHADVTKSDVALYLCPSDRAARAWRQRLLARGETFADCVPVENWLADLWARAQLFGIVDDARELVEPAALSATWYKILGDVSDMRAPECGRVARLIEDAWMLALRHNFPMRQIRGLAEGDDNIALFATCAIGMRRRLQERNAITRAELPVSLLDHRRTLMPLLPSRIVLTPSFSTDPAVMMLLAGFTELGAVIETLPQVAGNNRTPEVIACADHALEMSAALDWAEAQLESSIESTVALIVPDLATRRALWLRALRARFNADRWWCDPASDRDHFNLSVGDTVDAVPHIASLLALLSATVSEQDTESLAQALRHGRWGRSAKSGAEIGQVQRDLLENGIDRCTLADWTTIPTLMAAAALAGRPSEQAKSHTARRRAHRERVEALADALTEQPSLARSDLFQLEATWTTLLDRWEQFDQWLDQVTWADALGELSRLAGQTSFQPQAGTARLQVMGLLESAGVPLGAARIVGLHDRVLPERLKPHPMLPRGWQISQRVGLGAVAEADARAARLWTNWIDLCGTLSISWAKEDEGAAMRPSPLVQRLPVRDHVCLPKPPVLALLPHAVSTVVDEQLPAHAGTSVGLQLSARALEDQAQCPRRAAATRLGLREWPEHAVGIPARVRGTIVHAVLAAVGQQRMQSAEVSEPSPSDTQLRDTAQVSLDIGIAEQAARFSRIAPIVWRIERTRVMALVEQVLRLEHTRPGFAIVAVEAVANATVFAQEFRLRIDRVDRSLSDDDNRAIRVVLDYKTGKVARGGWFAERTAGRLAAPQLPLYALILSEDTAQAPVRALGYIVVGDDEEPKYVGVGDDLSMTPVRASSAETSWDALSTGWRSQIAALVAEIQGGVADVAPLEGQSTCRHCAFGPFCREPWSLNSEPGDMATSADPGDPVSDEYI